MKAIRFGAKGLIPGFEIGLETLPAIIFIQEWWGVTEIVKQQAHAFYSKGFRVLIPDLYKGVIGVNREEASHLLTSLDYHLAVEEICEAVSYLKATGSPKVGISGGCMGGALSFAAAQHCKNLSCAAPLYGTPAREMPWIDPTQISIPVSYHTGMLDNIRGFSDPENAIKVCNQMKRQGCCVELYLYENTPHSFLNGMSPEGIEFLQTFGYQVPPQEQVWLCFNRLVEFFSLHLKND